MHVSISPGNTKMGHISSISLPPGLTCPTDAPCFKDCYAQKLLRIRPPVKDAYARNFRIFRLDPEQYFREVEAAIMTSRFFRFHVAGDIVDDEYFARMVDVAERNKHCEILCFTKRYGIINQYIQDGLAIPKNLHIIFSVWRGYPHDNPFHLPEAHVRYKDGKTTADKNAILCKGNCTDCAKTNGGCWSLLPGQQIVFDQH